MVGAELPVFIYIINLGYFELYILIGLYFSYARRLARLAYSNIFHYVSVYRYFVVLVQLF